jgi:UDP:flavonoid glycosyltransferase YjiC (YdhE family)
MSHYLLPSTPMYGHVAPMIGIGRGLLRRGHRVTLLTGSKFRSAAVDAGLSFLPLPAEADYDDADLDAWLPGRDRYRGLAAGRYDVIGLFVGPLPAQHRALTAALAADVYDAVVCEAAFLGALPLLLTGRPGTRPPVVGISATPLQVRSVDCAPFGSGLHPRDSPFTRNRNRIIDAFLQRGPLRPINRALEDALATVGVHEPAGSYFDHATAFDVTFHLAPPSMEYPRRELPASVRFTGPLRTGPVPPRVLPSWWGDLDGGRPVVHVTQGTLDNVDPGKLMVPTIAALAREDVLVVASTGGRPVETVRERFVGRWPGNVRLAEFLPYDDLLPKTAAVVTNGGFGGVQRALAAGVPLVVAGRGEDKPEVAARVSWCGAGVDLRTDRPSPAQVRRAVAKVLNRPRYRSAAERVQREIAACGDPVETIAETLEALGSGVAVH